MANRNFYIQIISRLILLIVMAFISLWLWLKEDQVIWSIIIGSFVPLIAYFLIRYFNSVNRWISYFLLGIENEDTSLKPPKSYGNRAIDDVYARMMKLNDKFHQAKVDMMAQEQYFKKIINQASTGLFSINSNNRVLNINPAATKLTGLYEHHHINSIKKLNEDLSDFLIHEPLIKRSAIFENSKGHKLLFKLSEIKIQEYKMRLVAVSDITREMDTGEVDAWIKLARTLSHEIMNNITPVTTLAHVVKGYFMNGEEAKQAEEVNEKLITNTIKGLNIIEERSRGLMNFVENYRKFTSLPKADMRSIRLAQVIDDIMMMMQTYEGFDKIRIIKAFHKDLTFSADKNFIHHVILNVIKNAYEALNEGRTRYPELTIQYNQKEGKNILSISNNGPEIPPEIRQEIFIPFFTTRENGNGIGLSLSRQMMLSMNGDMALRVEEGMSIFVISWDVV